MRVGKRILYIADAYLESLFSARPIGISNALRKLGVHLDLILLSKDGKEINSQQELIYFIICGERSYLTSLVTIFKVMIFVFRNWNRYDTIIMEPNSVLAVVPFAIFARMLHIKLKPLLILDVRTQPVEVPRNFRGFIAESKFSFVLGMAMRFLDGMTVITEEMEKYIRHMKGRLPYRVGTWTSGIDLNIFDPKIPYEAIDLFKDRFVIMYHGQLSPTRGLDNILVAVDKIREDSPEVFVFFIGSGSMKAKLEEMIESMHLRDHAAVRDPIDHKEVPRYIKSADVGILAFPDHKWWRVQSPIKLLEYMAMEKAVIATDIPMNRSVIRSCNCAFVIRDNSPEEIAKGIRLAIKQRAALSVMGKTGRDLVKNKYTWERQAEGILRYLNKLTVQDKR